MPEDAQLSPTAEGTREEMSYIDITPSTLSPSSRQQGSDWGWAGGDWGGAPAVEQLHRGAWEFSQGEQEVNEQGNADNLRERAVQGERLTPGQVCCSKEVLVKIRKLYVLPLLGEDRGERQRICL